MLVRPRSCVRVLAARCAESARALRRCRSRPPILAIVPMLIGVLTGLVVYRATGGGDDD
ncbi:MAG: hypothetical protein MI785_10750 [Kiloniellales bacterium]|nr:hypothetical protein [Kiloniellales bacterium]